MARKTATEDDHSPPPPTDSNIECPIEMSSVCLGSLMPYHTVTSSALLNSMLSNAFIAGILKVSYVTVGEMMPQAIDDIMGMWMWGNIPVQSSIDTKQFSLVSCPTPVPVWDLHGHTVVKVACGNEHVVALVSAGETDNGGDLICYAWGGNSNGQLGLGDNESRLHPQIIENFKAESPWKVYDVACVGLSTQLYSHTERDQVTP